VWLVGYSYLLLLHIRLLKPLQKIMGNVWTIIHATWAFFMLQTPYSIHLNIYQKGVYYSGIKIFNSLPQDIKTYIDNTRTFKKAINKFLYTNSFYSLNEYYDNNSIRINL